MTADELDIVFGICDEHILIVRIRTVGRIGQPEVLPYKDTVFVACVVELFVTRLAHPVAYHIEIHLLMIRDRLVVFIGTIAEEIFAEAPVAALREEAVAVDI